MLLKSANFAYVCRRFLKTNLMPELSVAANLAKQENKVKSACPMPKTPQKQNAKVVVDPISKLRTKTNGRKYFDEFPISYPDFLPSMVWNRRDPLFEDLVNLDMMERRTVIDIPEFYVGSILAVTTSDKNLKNHENRFVGICIHRHKNGLQHRFTLRNIIDGLGIEVMYEMYNPTILKIETLKLEKRLDEDLTYLIDALPEYSTFDFNMEPLAHPVGTPIPVNPIKVKLRPPPWRMRWEMYDLKGIEDSWTQATPWYKRKLAHLVPGIEAFQKFDLIKRYRFEAQELEHDLRVQDQMREFEEKRQESGGTKRKILRSAVQVQK